LFSLLLHPQPDQEDYLVADLYEYGATGITEEDHGIRAFFDPPADASLLVQRFAAYQPELAAVEPVDWVQVTRDAWPPILVGQRFYLVPPWCDTPAPPGHLRLEIEPGMACGTGRHPATQLCLEALERHVRRGSSVLDVGTGSGILARAAELLGAGRVTACDIDPDSVDVARRRLRWPLFIGSASAVRSHSQDLIVANIDAAGIELLASEFERVRKPGSTLILSGFPEGDSPRGFHPVAALHRSVTGADSSEERWLCLIC
jgi:ribosomal protein L11 methyltransferase